LSFLFLLLDIPTTALYFPFGIAPPKREREREGERERGEEREGSVVVGREGSASHSSGRQQTDRRTDILSPF